MYVGVVQGVWFKGRQSLFRSCHMQMGVAQGMWFRGRQSLFRSCHVQMGVAQGVWFRGVDSPASGHVMCRWVWSRGYGSGG